MEVELNELQVAALKSIAAAEKLTDLQQAKVHYLGKQGALTTLLKGVGKLPPEEKPKVGELVNRVKSALTIAFDEKEALLQQQAVQQKLQSERIDVTLSGRVEAVGSLHPISRVKQRVGEIFSTMGFEIAEGPEIEDEYHNFEALNIPADHPARAMQDTFYLKNHAVLRTHTSPVQVRVMQDRGAPLRLIAMGRVFRRDSDQTHTPMFHQMEGLVVDRGVKFIHLKSMLHDFLSAFFGRPVKLRFRPSYFPFTEPSAEVDIYQPETDRWLEVLGCGMVHPKVFQNVGIDTEIYSGFAFGIGLDRLAMLRYQIPDLRLLFENDIRFLDQF